MVMLADHAAKIGPAARVARGALRFRSVAMGGAGLVVRSAALRLALAMRGPGSLGSQSAARLAFAARAAVVAIGPGRTARGVRIVKDLRRVSISAARGLSGPGQSVGEVVQAMPAALAGYPLPVGFIGRKLAALAVARGEVAAVVGNTLTVGGRVVIDAGGDSVFVEASGAARALRVLALEAAGFGAGVVLAAGQVRDAWLSERRIESAAYVKKNAKAAMKIDNESRRAAALADLRFMELRA